MSEFKGITNEYRKSDEYKAWVHAIQCEYPDMPLYIIEMSICAHQMDPQFYKKYMRGSDPTRSKNEKRVQAEFDAQLKGSQPQAERARQFQMAKSQPMQTEQVAVNVYNSSEEIPPHIIKDDETEAILSVSSEQ